jgi:acyl-CoA thioesterase FadM
MNLLLRLIRVLIHALFRQRLGLFDTSVLCFWVGPFDLDINRHMTNSRYLSLMDLGRLDLLIRFGLMKTVWKRKWGTVLGSANVRWRLGLTLFQSFELHTRTLGWDEKWLYMDQKVVRQGVVICHALLKGTFTSQGRTVPVAEILAYMGEKNSLSPELPASIRNWQASEADMRQDAKNFNLTPTEKDNGIPQK